MRKLRPRESKLSKAIKLVSGIRPDSQQRCVCTLFSCLKLRWKKQAGKRPDYSWESAVSCCAYSQRVITTFAANSDTYLALRDHWKEENLD